MRTGRPWHRGPTLGKLALGGLPLLLFLLGRSSPTQHEGPAGPDRRSPHEPGLPLSPQAPRPARVPTRGDWVLVDALTKQRLTAPGLALVDGARTRTLDAPLLSERDRSHPGTRLSFLQNELPGAATLSRPCLGLPTLPDADQPTLAVGWSSGVQGVVFGEERGVPLGDAWVDAWLLDAATWRTTLDASLPEPLEAMAPRGSFQHRLLAYDYLRLLACRDGDAPAAQALLDYVTTGRRDDATAKFLATADEAFPLPHVRTRTDLAGRFSLVLPGSGRVLLRFVHPDRVVRFQELETAPGQAADLAVRLRRRPRLRVVLLDEDGDPIPHHRVKVLVHMDPTRFDASELGGDARFAQVAVGAPGRLETTRVRTRQTDQAGEAVVTVPWGREYAAQAIVDDEFLFTTAPAPTAGTTEVRLVLRCGAAEGDRGRLTILDRTGRPCAGAELRLGLPGDPWQRQLPSVRLDEQGSVTLAWFPRGAEVAGAVRLAAGDGGWLPLEPFVWSPPTTSTTPASRRP